MNGVSLQSVSIARIAHFRGRWGARFTERFFTAAEREYCEPKRRADQHYAARLAAKLAVRRLLGSITLSQVEVERDEAGAPALRLTGLAAARSGDRRFHLSLSHDGGLAVALVVTEASESGARS